MRSDRASSSCCHTSQIRFESGFRNTPVSTVKLVGPRKLPATAPPLHRRLGAPNPIRDFLEGEIPRHRTRPLGTPQVVEPR